MVASLSVALFIDITSPHLAREIEIGAPIELDPTGNRISFIYNGKHYVCKREEFPEYAELMEAIRYVEWLDAHVNDRNSSASMTPPAGVTLVEGHVHSVLVSPALEERIMARATEALALIDSGFKGRKD
jgi:hypothetical protein